MYHIQKNVSYQVVSVLHRNGVFMLLFYTVKFIKVLYLDLIIR